MIKTNFILLLLLLTITCLFSCKNEYSGYLKIDTNIEFELGKNLTVEFEKRITCSSIERLDGKNKSYCYYSDVDSSDLIFYIYENHTKLKGISIIGGKEAFAFNNPRLSTSENKNIIFNELSPGEYYDKGFFYSKIIHEDFIYLNFFKIDGSLNKFVLPPNMNTEYD